MMLYGAGRRYIGFAKLSLSIVLTSATFFSFSALAENAVSKAFDPCQGQAPEKLIARCNRDPKGKPGFTGDLCLVREGRLKYTVVGLLSFAEAVLPNYELRKTFDFEKGPQGPRISGKEDEAVIKGVQAQPYKDCSFNLSFRRVCQEKYKKESLSYDKLSHTLSLSDSLSSIRLGCVPF